jgi:HK97 family phage major capsid protein
MQRALSTTDGAGGEFVPPLWMINQFFDLARAGRVTADQVAQQQLPPGTDTISLPRLVTGTAVAEQSAQNAALRTPTRPPARSPPQWRPSAVFSTVSQQLLDQSPVNMDDILLADLAADYAVKLDTFVMSNNATNKVGLLNVSGVNAVSLHRRHPDRGRAVRQDRRRDPADPHRPVHARRQDLHAPAPLGLVPAAPWALRTAAR